MHIDHLKTFLEIATTGSLSEAAVRLNVTQSTVSARLRALEDRLERALFLRHRNGAAMTVAGQQFHRHALTAVRAWEHGRQEVSLPPGYQESFALGAQTSLWDELVVPWISWFRAQLPNVALRLSADYSDNVLRQLTDGALDVGLLYVARNSPGLVTEPLFDERLVLVSTKRQRSLEAALDPKRYVYVDWGEDFRAQHHDTFPQLDSATISVDLGAAALRYLLNVDGSAYFPLRVVRNIIADKRLFRVQRAPTFSRPVYIAYAREPADEEIQSIALRGLYAAAKTAGRQR
ncbi:MAG: LysR family transcriptional regulator [Gammaproteobacteria bacterium]|nr:LysR family transcriptional regulator [Gammaproteobacteria bacterium]